MALVILPLALLLQVKLAVKLLPLNPVILTPLLLHQQLLAAQSAATMFMSAAQSQEQLSLQPVAIL